MAARVKSIAVSFVLDPYGHPFKVGQAEARPARTKRLRRCDDGHQLERRARPVLGDSSLAGNRPMGARQLVLRQQPRDEGFLPGGVGLAVTSELLAKAALHVGVSGSGVRIDP
jgi:hypothetical protein